MPVILPEMINDQITRRDLLPLSFLKMSSYTGSKRKMNYKLEKTEVPVEAEVPAGTEAPAGTETAAPEPEMKTVLRVYVWPGPFAFDNTEEEKIKQQDVEFSDAGIDNAIEILNKELKNFD
ncbi:MAG: hypothetical protein Q4E57_10250 [Eubacteriales bacterium]|nr:hypothetical protein [Eubacteriales bacterium]